MESVSTLTDDVTLTGLAIDLAKVQTTVSESARRLENIEKNMSGISDLSLLIVSTKTLTEQNERRISVVEIRAETIDKNVSEITTHGLRLTSLETDLIKNGELRMSTLEKGKAKMFAILGTVTISAAGWAFVNYIVPMLHR
jgi:hypothetical protein